MKKHFVYMLLPVLYKYFQNLFIWVIEREKKVAKNKPYEALEIYSKVVGYKIDPLGLNHLDLSNSPNLYLRKVSEVVDEAVTEWVRREQAYHDWIEANYR